MPPRELLDRCDRTLDRVRSRGRRAAVRRPARPGSTTSGRAPTSRSPASPRSSRRCAGTSSRVAPGVGARRRPRHLREGRHRVGLRRPLLLGHRDLRDARSSRTRRPGRPATRCASGYSLLDVRARPRPRAGPEGRAVPVAHDQRRGGLGLLRRRHRAVPHRRRHRLRAEPVRRRHGRQRLPATAQAIDIFVETARLWADLGFWREEDGGAFHIHGVTGPDEYTTVVNDNLYTNVMARFNLRRAAEAVRDARGAATPTAYAAMVRRVRLDGRRARGVARVRGGDDDPLRRAPRHPPAGLPLPRARDVGPRAAPRSRSGRCCCTTTRW